MPFPYRFVCDLLQQLEEEARSTSKEKTPNRPIIERWFHEHRVRLDAPTVNGCAVISALLPERRTDRVYGIQVPRLESIVGQALILGSSRVKELRRYKTPGQGVDLGDCVESILSRAVSSVTTMNPSHGCDAVLFGNKQALTSAHSQTRHTLNEKSLRKTSTRCSRGLPPVADSALQPSGRLIQVEIRSQRTMSWDSSLLDSALEMPSGLPG